MIRVEDLLGWIDAYAPFRYAAPWDHCGLQIGDPEGGIEAIMLALDVTTEVLDEAAGKGCQSLVTHHPLIFKPLDSVRFDTYPGKIIVRAIRKNIHLIAAHTNLDVARGGTNEHLARLLGLEDTEPLEAELVWREEGRYLGLGSVGALAAPMVLEALAGKVRDLLEAGSPRVIGDPRKTVRRVALCTGSGASLIDRALSAGAEAYVTGDIKYHEARLAEESGLAIIDVGHFASERLILEPLAAWLRSRAEESGGGVGVFVAESERDPFRSLGVQSAPGRRVAIQGE